jgi:hypothetical protein
MPRDAPLFCAMRQRAARYGLPPRHARRFHFRMTVARFISIFHAIIITFAICYCHFAISCRHYAYFASHFHYYFRFSSFFDYFHSFS